MDTPDEPWWEAESDRDGGKASDAHWWVDTAPRPPAEDLGPIRLVVRDPDLKRSRLTVVVRLILAIPLLLWLALWSFITIFVGIATWFIVLVKGVLPVSLYDYYAAYIRFVAHLQAYLSFAANPYPPFAGPPDRYPVDVEIDKPVSQRRWTVAVRVVLAIPALAMSSALAGSVPIPPFAFGDTSGAGMAQSVQGGAALFVAAFLGWFVCLVSGSMAPGLRDLAVYAIGYGAQVTGYFFMLTDRYPSAHPARVRPLLRLPHHPVRLRQEDDCHRSRLLVILRLPLAVPHIVWLLLWSAVVIALSPFAWLLTIALGRLPRPLHRFLRAYVVASGQVAAFLTVVAGPFPGFVGAGGFPVALDIDEPAPQHRAVTVFRLLLAYPAFIIASAYWGLLFVLAVLLWLAGLFTAKVPPGLQAVGAAGIRYTTQTNAYVLLLTDRYPYASPALLPEELHHEQLELELAPRPQAA
jgi:hypothetical protein